jgi:hypothetical protein
MGENISKLWKGYDLTILGQNRLEIGFQSRSAIVVPFDEHSYDLRTLGIFMNKTTSAAPDPFIRELPACTVRGERVKL